jgi:hypothetical protein
MLDWKKVERIGKEIAQYVSTGFTGEKEPVEGISSKRARAHLPLTNWGSYGCLVEDVLGRLLGWKIFNWPSDPLKIWINGGSEAGWGFSSKWLKVDVCYSWRVSSKPLVKGRGLVLMWLPYVHPNIRLSERWKPCHHFPLSSYHFPMRCQSQDVNFLLSQPTDFWPFCWSLGIPSN